jgi:hypothetical protein
MPLFRCSGCGAIENTALCHFWMSSKLEGKDPLCSLCDPEIAKWHGIFPRKSADGMLMGNDGFLYEPELFATGSFDGMIRAAGLKIVGVVGPPSHNLARILEIKIRERAELEGLKLADDFEQRISDLERYFNEPVDWVTGE